jgi:hypothetical protein
MTARSAAAACAAASGDSSSTSEQRCQRAFASRSRFRHGQRFGKEGQERHPRSRSIPGSNSGSAVTVAAMRSPKYSTSTESPTPTAAGSPEYKRRAVQYLKHSWKAHALSRALASSLEDSRESSSWPGDRLQVGTLKSRRVELITQRLQRETEAWGKQVTHPRISLGG